MGQSAYNLWRPMCDFFGAKQLRVPGRTETPNKQAPFMLQNGAQLHGTILIPQFIHLFECSLNAMGCQLSDC